MASKATYSKTKTRVKKDGAANKAGYMQCNICHGTGVVKRPPQNQKKK